MNKTRIRQLAERVRELPHLALVARPNRKVGHRTNDPIGPYAERMGPLPTLFAESIRAGWEHRPVQQLNLTVGWQPEQGIAGLAMLAVTLWPEEAARLAPGEERTPTLVELGGRLLGTWGEGGKRALTALLLHGPAGWGRRAAWAGPAEAAAALDRAAAGTPVEQWWDPADDERFRVLEHRHWTDPHALERWKERTAREASGQGSEPADSEARAREQWGRQRRPLMDPNVGTVDVLAWIADGAAIHKGATVGRLCHIAYGACIGEGVQLVRTRIGRGTSVGRTSSIGFETRIGSHCQIGAQCVIRPDARIGSNTTLGEETRVGDGAVIGDRVAAGNRVEIGAGAVIEGDVGVAKGAWVRDGAHIGKGSIVGAGCRIGARVHVPDGTLIPEGTNLQNEADVARLTFAIVGDERSAPAA